MCGFWVIASTEIGAGGGVGVERLERFPFVVRTTKSAMHAPDVAAPVVSWISELSSLSTAAQVC